MFKEKQEELQPQYDHLKNLGKQLKQIRTDYKIEPQKSVPPQAATSFMNRRGKQAKQYTQTTEALREVRKVRE